MSDATTPAGPTSPFKFLDAYGAQDASVFFGRDDEIESLYRLLGESRLVLVYGQSGTGKTSLVQCGLTKKFSPTNWLPITVRRGDDIGAALNQALSAAAITPLAPGAPVVDAIRSVFLDHLRPVFLIFDQFEELYVLGTRAEQEAFYATIRAVLDTDVSCRIIVLLREEYLAALDPFERAVPALFDKRLRVEVMTNSNVEKVIVGTCAAKGIVLEHGVDTARLIIAQLDDKRVGVQLAYLQVYLDHLYRTAAGGSGPVTFTDAAIAEAGKLGDIMAGFLDEQERAIEVQLDGRVPPGGIARLLEEFVSVDGTKQPSTYAEVLGRIPSAEPWLQSALDLMQNSRLLRRVDDHYELAHDALAGRIAERRSGERKQLLMVEKLVQNRVAEFTQTKTLLNSEELGLVKSAGKLLDPLDGSPLLKLDVQAAAFVKKSRRKLWNRRLGIGGAILGGLMVPLTMGIYSLAQSQAVDDSNVNANNVVDVMGFGAFANMHSSQDPNALMMGKWMHDFVRTTLIKRDMGDVLAAEETTMETVNNSFWARLYDADVKMDGTHDAEGLAIYAKLEDELRGQRRDNPNDVYLAGKLKAVLWHHLFMQPPDLKLVNELFDLMESQQSEIGGDPLGFEDDMIDLCVQDAVRAMAPQRCKRHQSPGGSPPAGTEAASEDAAQAESGAAGAPAIKY